ncbi:MAG TPA: RidA family protein [Candidatus Berkiella sp.]|nr:RidA family protein [Candidatus Berkiella sp.]
MVTKYRIQTEQAPQAVGCYSQGIRSGNWVFLSGQIGLNPQTMQMVEGGIIAELEQCLRNLKAVLASVGGDFSHIVKVTVFLKDLGNYTVLNEIMQKYFTTPYPARSALEVSRLPRDALVEIEAIAVI